MDRVAEMKFCPPEHPPPEPSFERAQDPESRARDRFSLVGKCAIVSGGARGLALTVAQGMLEHGLSKLALFDIDLEELCKAAEILRSQFPTKKGDIISKAVDITKSEEIFPATQNVAVSFGKIDILACFAGIVNSTRAVDYTPEGFRNICDVNTTGTFLTAQAVGREMIARKSGGSIILTASMAGHVVNAPQVHVAYGTSKAGVHHMTRCLAAEWAEYGIRVNSLSPGYMDTRLNASSDLTDVVPLWLEKTPMGRFGRKEELIGPVVLLASDGGSYMTGADLRIDGGYTLF